MSGPPGQHPGGRHTEAALLAALLGLCLLFYGLPVPAGNEYIYLLQSWQQAHPEFLAGDWSLLARSGGHRLFTALTAGAMEVLPLAVVGWLGRLVCWTAVLVALMRLGRKLGLGAALAALGIALWLAMGQSLVGGEWIVGGFEAKVAAWALVFWGIDQLLEGRARTGGALVGLAFTMHAAVGLSAIPAVALGLLVAGTPRPALVRAGTAALAGALPGAIWAGLLAAGSSTDRGLWEMVVRVRMPFHLDPLTFGRQRLLTLGILTGLSLSFAWRHPSRAVRFLAGVELAGALIFLAGLAVRLGGAYEWLRFFPFRFLPPVVLLVFLWQALLVLIPENGTRPRPVLRVAMLVALLALPSVLNGFLSRIQQRSWEDAQDAGLAAALTWVRDSTPPDALIIAPPWRRDAFWLAQRPLVVHWSAVPYAALPQWHARLEAFVGPLVPEDRRGLSPATLAARYEALPADSLTRLARGYGALFLVSRSLYALPVLHQADAWRVYDVATWP